MPSVGRIRPEGVTQEARNRPSFAWSLTALRLSIAPITARSGRAQARFVDFDDPANNDWLAVFSHSTL